MQFNSIWPIDRALSDATIPGQSRPESHGHENVLRIPQSPGITGTLPSDHLVSYPGHPLGVSYPSAEVLTRQYTELMSNNFILDNSI